MKHVELNYYDGMDAIHWQCHLEVAKWGVGVLTKALEDVAYQNQWPLVADMLKVEHTIIKACMKKDSGLLARMKDERDRLQSEARKM